MSSPLDKILKLGHPDLYLKSEMVKQYEISSLEDTIVLMGECILAYREKYGQGRAIAAPQVGLRKRMIVLNIEHPYPIFNPEFIDRFKHFHVHAVLAGGITGTAHLAVINQLFTSTYRLHTRIQWTIPSEKNCGFASA